MSTNQCNEFAVSQQTTRRKSSKLIQKLVFFTNLYLKGPVVVILTNMIIVEKACSYYGNAVSELFSLMQEDARTWQ